MPLHIIGMNIEILDLGLIDYEQAWKLQDEYAGEIAKGLRPPTLLLLEHPHVYTFGRKGNASNLLWNENQLKEKGIATYWVDRGGDVTYHGPGQLVGYPLIPLGRLNQDNRLPEADYVGYIRKLETMLIGVLMNYGIASGQRPGKTGVWIQADVHSRCIHCKPEDKQKPAKIAAIGVKVDVNGVTRHGFALNVNPDMDYWNGIIPCGLTEPVVSLADLLNQAPSMQEVKQHIKEAFCTVFENSM
ncbi:MAG TPA: lipoyl(octanoyl) transferase LipB [Anaerolineales bacterium]|nr:lipoyl(octanoyl) transferase LipB [Anaerolineales bacterium]HNF94327.1 lipoyl(octanoyl) transferase LipB [Anaerolineales bacterium]